MNRALLFFSVLVILAACASKVLHYEKAQTMDKIDEYEKMIKVKEIPQPLPPSLVESSTAVAVTEGTTIHEPVITLSPAGAPEVKKPKVEAKVKAKPGGKVAKHLPDLEDGEGFDGRRPLIDPFRVGEKVTLTIEYFKMTAGEMDMVVGPYTEVNGEKAYNFVVNMRSSSLFSSFYSVDDQASTFVNFNSLLPYNINIHVKESKQLAEIRTFFDFKKNKANFWKKKFTKDKGEENKKIEWSILPYSQNVISAAFYLRNFTLRPGKKLAFRVADEGKNIVFKGEVLREEKLETPIGPLSTVVVRPEIQVDGLFKPMGEILIWLTNDERKYIVRIDSKIKIGTLRARLKSIEPGI